MQKPHKGRFLFHRKVEYDNHKIYEGVETLGFLFVGQFLDHPTLSHNPGGHTSLVVKYDEETGEFETLNSRYTLIK